jgi:hypothetical protein
MSQNKPTISKKLTNVSETNQDIWRCLFAEKKKELSEDTFIDFDGQTCDNFQGKDESNCKGWNGLDRRCECGNQRVGWVLSDCKSYIYPEPY